MERHSTGLTVKRIGRCGRLVALVVVSAVLAGCGTAKPIARWNAPMTMSITEAVQIQQRCQKEHTDKAAQDECNTANGLKFGGYVTPVAANQAMLQQIPPGGSLKTTAWRPPAGMAAANAKSAHQACLDASLAIRRSPGMSTKEHDQRARTEQEDCYRKRGFEKITHTIKRDS
jgi:hypothetical protein